MLTQHKKWCCICFLLVATTMSGCQSLLREAKLFDNDPARPRNHVERFAEIADQAGLATLYASGKIAWHTLQDFVPAMTKAAFEATLRRDDDGKKNTKR